MSIFPNKAEKTGLYTSCKHTGLNFETLNKALSFGSTKNSKGTKFKLHCFIFNFITWKIKHTSHSLQKPRIASNSQFSNYTTHCAKQRRLPFFRLIYSLFVLSHSERIKHLIYICVIYIDSTETVTSCSTSQK